MSARLALLLVSCLVPVPQRGASQAQSPLQMQDDEDTLLLTRRKAFCQHLAARIAAMQHVVARPHRDADQIAAEGVHMCEQGRVLQGIRQLRYALIELSELEESDR